MLEKRVLRIASGPKKHKYDDEQELHQRGDSQLVSHHILLEERNESVRGGRYSNTYGEIINMYTISVLKQKQDLRVGG